MKRKKKKNTEYSVLLDTLQITNEILSVLLTLMVCLI